MTTITSITKNLPGLVVPPLTPFTSDLKLDVEALERGVNYVVRECSAAMVVAAGVEAQEYQYLDMAERRGLIRHTIDFVGGRCPVVVGVSHASFKTSIALAQYAQDLGAQAVQILAPLRPFGGEATPSEIVGYLDAIGQETPLPVMLYLNSGPGATLSPEVTVELAEREYVHFIKESSRDLSRISRLIEEIDRAGLARYFTTSQMLLISLQLGGSGCTLPPPAARLGALILRAFLAEDIVEATRLQRQFSLYPAKWMKQGLLPTMKASLQILGNSAGDPYPPYPPITGPELEALRLYLSTTDIFPEEEN